MISWSFQWLMGWVPAATMRTPLFSAISTSEPRRWRTASRASRMSAHTGRAHLHHAAVQLGLDLVAEVRARDQHLLDVALQLARVGIDELELFFDAEGEVRGSGQARAR